MQRKRYHSEFLRQALSDGWLEAQPLSLLDVGASGGIDGFWNQFRPQLRAVGFDPLVNEVDRLKNAEVDPQIRYEAAWVGDGTQRDWPPRGQTLHSISSAARATDLMHFDYAQVHFNSGSELVYSDRILTLDAFVEAGGIDDPDTIKIDVDGFDYFVLEGARKILQEGRVVMVECECTFHELIGSAWPCFSDIDRFMRSCGYRLVDLDPWRYTRRDLPGRFVYDIAAQTESGQVHFCDALYVLDITVDPAALARLRAHPAKLAKSVLLLEAFGYPDLAAATLMRMRAEGIGPPGLDIDTALDRLVPANPFGAADYKSYIAAFEAGPDRFMPAGWRAAESDKPVMPTSPVVPTSLYRRARHRIGNALRGLGLR